MQNNLSKVCLWDHLNLVFNSQRGEIFKGEINIFKSPQITALLEEAEIIWEECLESSLSHISILSSLQHNPYLPSARFSILSKKWWLKVYALA